MSRQAAHSKKPPELLRRVADNLRTKCGVAEGTRTLVGVSGGCDSVALLRALAEISPEYDLHLTVAHFDHGLRPDSAEDAHFVVELAAQQGVEICVGAWQRPEPGEAAARLARHAFLSRTAQSHGCTVLALAHQLEDQIETVLMRLGRGTGPRGLSGMAWRRSGAVDIVRPLLDCRREALTTYLRALAQTWREDPSNHDQTRTRNRVRHDLLPALERTFGVGSQENWAAAVDDMRALWDYVSVAADALLARSRRRSLVDERGRTELCDLAPLRGAPSAVSGAALQRWFESIGCANVRRQHIRAALNLLQNGQSGHQLALPGSAHMRLEQDAVAVVVSSESSVPLQRPAVRVDFETAKPSTALDGAVLERQESRLDVETTSKVPDREHIVRDSSQVTAPETLPAELVAWVDADRAGPQPWIVRTRQPGERVRLLGAPGSRKISRLFQDHRIPHRLRHTWPVVANAAGIFWVPGIGIAARVRVHGGTQRAARLTLRTSWRDGGRLRSARATQLGSARVADEAPNPPRPPRPARSAAPSDDRDSASKPAPRAAVRRAAWGG